MTKFGIVTLLVGFSPALFGARFSATVHSIDHGNGSEPHLVRFNNGRVSFIPKEEEELLNALEINRDREESVEIRTDEKNDIYSAQTMEKKTIHILEEYRSIIEPVLSFRPTIVKNYNAALRIFNSMRKDYTSHGECYNRAHIWSYEEHKKNKLNLMKVFMFFTEKYIRNYKFHWWFHVTPMVYVQSRKSPRTLDRRYTSGPRQTKTWSDVFVKSKRLCKKVSKFDDFWLNQKTEDCYHIHASMYYVIPRDLEKRDITGVEKEGFSEREIRKAYKNGFDQ